MSIAPAHSPFGGSVAARILRCPASVALVAKVPAHLRKTSVYAARGTALHPAMAILIEGEQRVGNLAGATIDSYTITIDDVENALRPVLAYVEALLDAPGAEFYLESRVAFPGIPDTFGTADLIVRVGDTIHLIDFKFGAGVRVLAVRPDGDDDVINAQLAFYAAAARHSIPEFFAGVDTIVLAILQPQSIEPGAEMVSSVTVTHAELDAFAATYRGACAEALGGRVAPIVRLEKGSYQKLEHGKIWFPVMTVVDWMPLDGPATAPASPPPPTSPPPASAADQPRRRRVG